MLSWTMSGAFENRKISKFCRFSSWCKCINDICHCDKNALRTPHPVYTGESKNSVVTPKAHQIFSVHTTLAGRNLKTVKKPWVHPWVLGCSHMIISSRHCCLKAVYKMFFLTLKRKTGVLKFFRLKSVLEKHRLRSWLVWTEGLTL